jgi:hypothetical protein
VSPNCRSAKLTRVRVVATGSNTLRPSFRRVNISGQIAACKDWDESAKLICSNRLSVYPKYTRNPSLRCR